MSQSKIIARKSQKRPLNEVEQEILTTNIDPFDNLNDYL